MRPFLLGKLSFLGDSFPDPSKNRLWQIFREALPHTPQGDNPLDPICLRRRKRRKEWIFREDWS